MEFVNRKVAVAAAPPPPPPLPPSSSCISSRRLEERIWKLLSKWAALEMAVENEWGGPDSIVKSHKLASDVLSWLFHSKGEIKVEDLENLLHERLLLTFNTEIEDGSIEEVAEQLMNIRDEYLHGNIISVNSVQSNNNIHQPLLHQKVLQQKKTANSAEKSWSYDHQDTLNVSYTW